MPCDEQSSTTSGAKASALSSHGMCSGRGGKKCGACPSSITSSSFGWRTCLSCTLARPTGMSLWSASMNVPSSCTILNVSGCRPGPHAERFERYVLLAPALGFGSGAARPPHGHYSVAPRRILGLYALNALGIHALDALPVLAFGVPPDKARAMTGSYSFRLLASFGPHADALDDLRRSTQPMSILVGASDDVFPPCGSSVHAWLKRDGGWTSRPVRHFAVH